jgi:hypothetical protein
LTRWSWTGYFIFLNSALVDWYSKQQRAIGSSVFGSKFVALKTGMEKSYGLCYKLRMMGIPVAGPTYTFGDNMSVIFNTLCTWINLEKEIKFYLLSCMPRGSCYGWNSNSSQTKYNPADIATKVLPGGWQHEARVNGLLYDMWVGMSSFSRFPWHMPKSTSQPLEYHGEMIDDELMSERVLSLPKVPLALAFFWLLA